MDNGEQSRGSVLIADDDETFVACVQELLARSGYRTLTATTGWEALRVAREEKPQVLLVDIQFPDLNGYEICRTLRDEFGHTLAIAFVSGTRTEPVDISSGLLLGADDYIVKPFDPGELLARVGHLTNRELEILQLLADGLRQGEIAQRLSISPKTVGVHIEHILPKLDVHSRAEAVALAYRKHLTPSR
jgi:DNA-binding NarL/FixJ family response regulator